MSSKLTVLSFGGGQDSTALLYRYVYDLAFRAKYAPNDFVVIMADTGDEHPSTVAHVKSTRDFCKEHGVEFVLITSEMGFHPTSWQGLREFYRLKNTIGSKAFPKTCTDNLKLVPIYKFLGAWLSEKYGVRNVRKSAFKEFAEKHGEINMLIGIAKGEETRMSSETPEWIVNKQGKNVRPPRFWMRGTVKRVYPLVDLGMDRKGCQEYIASVGKPVPTPSNCVLCPFMSEIELLWLYRFMPEDYADWVGMEANKIAANAHKGDQNLGVWGKKLLPEKLAEAQKKFGHMTDAELQEYKMSHGHCVKSKY